MGSIHIVSGAVRRWLLCRGSRLLGSVVFGFVNFACARSGTCLVELAWVGLVSDVGMGILRSLQRCVLGECGFPTLTFEFLPEALRLWPFVVSH